MNFSYWTFVFTDKFIRKTGRCILGEKVLDQLEVSCLVMLFSSGWWGGAKVLSKLLVPGSPTILITVGQGPTALAVGAGGGGLDIFTLIYPFSSLSPSLWETA